MPPKREAFFIGNWLLVIGYLVEKCWLVVVQLMKNSTHERLADETTAVRHTVFLAETI